MSDRDLLKGVELSAVEVSSSAWNMGLRAGDRLVGINGQEPEDALDLRFLLSTASEVDLVVVNGEGDSLHTAISDPESFLSGLEFERMEVKRCSNDCIYCFCKQNPPKARSSLFFRDEDFRMSFLAGTYTTMSSIGEKELDRIVRQRLSPQYITVPSTDDELRRHILGVKRARPIKEVLRRLLSSDITLHLQTVVIPELNDGAALESTISDLFLMDEGVESLAIVPVGTTKYTAHPAVRRPTIEELSQLHRQVRKWKRKKLGPDGVNWIEASDEVYLALGLRVPSRRKYGEFPQLSTGVGMVRTFMDDYRRLSKRKKPPWWGGRRAVIVSGELFDPTLMRFVSALNAKWGPGLRMVRANNRFFGGEVTVAGLLGGHDIESAVKGIEAQVILLSASCLDHSAERFVDDVTIGEFKERLGVEVVATGDTLTECFEAVTEQLF